jgi:ADP-heptose:LPS heptosyltransferase
MSAPQFIPTEIPVNLTVQRCPVSREEASHRIIIFQLGLFGEVLMASPLISALRNAYPNAHLTWGIDPKYADIVSANPYLDEIMLWSPEYFKKTLRQKPIIWIQRALDAKKLLNKRPMDIYISLLAEKWPTLVKYGIGAPRRIGVFDTHWDFFNQTRTHPRTKYYTDVFTKEDLPKHRTDMYLLPLKTLGIPQPAQEDKKMLLGFTQPDAEVAEKFLQKHQVTPKHRLIALAPSTTWETRCWPVDRFIELGKRLTAENPNTKLLVLGRDTPEERALSDPLLTGLAETNPIPAIGNLTFRQMAALVARCHLLVSGDTGTMHTAAAVGTPHLALFGPTPIQALAPLVREKGFVIQHPVPCGPCWQKNCSQEGDLHIQCMKKITVDEVANAILTVQSCSL